jgi:hypothetical protein
MEELPPKVVEMARHVFGPLPPKVVEMVRHVFGPLPQELPKVNVLAAGAEIDEIGLRSHCYLDDKGCPHLFIRYEDYAHNPFVVVHELAHWYHCWLWPKQSEACEENRAETAALLVEMLLFWDAESPYVSKKWPFRLRKFPKNVVEEAEKAYFAVKKEQFTLFEAMYICLCGKVVKWMGV